MTEAIVDTPCPADIHSTRARGHTLTAIAWLDMRETLRARWFQLYVVGFVSLMAIFFSFGLAESQVMGFHGLGRLLMTFIQITIVILPVFVLVTTARTLAGDREAGIWEYLLALPVGLSGYFWGRMLGRSAAMISPLVAALGGGALVEVIRGSPVPWAIVGYYALLVVSMTICFMGIAMLVSVLSRGQEMAIGVAFAIWLAVEAVIDALLLGLLLKERMPADVVIGAALLNPVQAFRTAALTLFDPELTVLGPISHTLLESLGPTGMLAWALGWPIFVGLVTASLGAAMFARRDAV